ncbi:MAG: hypothetical protein R3F14_17825 [Polyangiaceae bacterium]
MAPPARPRLAPLALALALAACGPAAIDAKTPAALSACDGARFATCAHDLAKAAREGDVSPGAVAAYVAALEKTGSGGAWGKLWGELSERGKARAAIVDTRGAGAPVKVVFPASAAGGAGEGTSATPPPPRVLVSEKLLDQKDISASELLLAMGAAAGYDHVVWLGAGDGSRSMELYPRDPIGPQMMGLPGIARDDAEPSHLAQNLVLAATVRRALEAAAASRYIEVASEAASLDAQIAGRDLCEEPVLRARYTRSTFVAAGIALEEPVSLFDSEPARRASALRPRARPLCRRHTLRRSPSRPCRRRRGRRVGSLRRRRARRDPRRSTRPRAVVFRPTARVRLHLAAPEYDRAADVGLAGLLAPALAGAQRPPISTMPERGLPLAEWYPRYERLVDLVDKKGFAWLQMGALLRQRGEPLRHQPRRQGVVQARHPARDSPHARAGRARRDRSGGATSAPPSLGLAYMPGLLSTPSSSASSPISRRGRPRARSPPRSSPAPSPAASSSAPSWA